MTDSSTDPHLWRPTCTLIIPLYNKAQLVRRTLDSVARQQPPYDQIVVVDDCSTDGGASIVENFIHEHPHLPVELIRHTNNSGPGAARNTGLCAVRCDYICFLDADDYLTLEATQELARVVPRLGAGLGVLVFGVREQDSGTVRPNFQRLFRARQGQQVSPGLLRLDDWASAMVEESLFCSGGNALLSRRLLECRFDPTQRNFEDWDFYFRACQAAADLGLDIVVSNHVGLIYADDDSFSLSRATTLTPALRNVPALVLDRSLPLLARQYTAGIWLCHVAQRSGPIEGLKFIWKSLKETAGARPAFRHLMAALLAMLVGRRGWAIASRLRKRVRYG